MLIRQTWRNFKIVSVILHHYLIHYISANWNVISIIHNDNNIIVNWVYITSPLSTIFTVCTLIVPIHRGWIFRTWTELRRHDEYVYMYMKTWLTKKLQFLAAYAVHSFNDFIMYHYIYAEYKFNFQTHLSRPNKSTLFLFSIFIFRFQTIFDNIV